MAAQAAWAGGPMMAAAVAVDASISVPMPGLQPVPAADGRHGARELTGPRPPIQRMPPAGIGCNPQA
jgi:hypothetical protein